MSRACAGVGARRGPGVSGVPGCVSPSQGVSAPQGFSSSPCGAQRPPFPAAGRGWEKPGSGHGAAAGPRWVFSVSLCEALPCQLCPPGVSQNKTPVVPGAGGPRIPLHQALCILCLEGTLEMGEAGKCPIMRDLGNCICLVCQGAGRGVVCVGGRCLHGWAFTRSSDEQQTAVRSGELELRLIGARQWAGVAPQPGWRWGLILLLLAPRLVPVGTWSQLGPGSVPAQSWLGPGSVLALSCPSAWPGPRCHRASAPSMVSAAGRAPGLSGWICHCDNGAGSSFRRR